jgi:gluconolactonase
VPELPEAWLIAEHLALPEGPVALADGSVVLVEIEAGLLSRVFPDGRKAVVADLGGGPNGAARGPDGAIYVANNGGHPDKTMTPSIQRVDLGTGKSEVLYTQCDGVPLRGPNDLVFDATGNFWFTDMAGNAIYYAAPDGSSIQLAVSCIAAPNGIGLAPDETILYWAQTYTRQVLRRRLRGPGQVVPSVGCGVEAVFAGGPDLDSLVAGLPGAQELDSLAVDSSGAVCVGTLVQGGGITVFSADGGSIEKYVPPPRLADNLITNICFGGPDMRDAYVTMSETGRLVACRWPRPGLVLNFQDLLRDRANT